MLWARSDGETFGQAIAEFSIRNKPVIATKVGALSHVAYLGNKGIWYNDEKNLTEILLNFNPEIESKKDWNAYKDYTPERVMKIFDDVFLKNNITQAEYKFYDFIEIGTSDLLFPLSQEEKHKIQSVNGLMTAKQYELIYKIIKQKSSCNVLVFGLGEDSYLWKSANKEGKTIFIENIKSWADRFSDLDIEIVNYKTTVLDYPNNLNERKLLLDLPEYIKNIKWDIIIIDSPVGHNPPCIEGQCKLCSPTNPAPGRMSSIFTASKLVHKNSIIIIDDINREIELHFISDNQVIKKDISATEKTQFGMNLLMAKYYSDAISDNTKRAIEQKLRKGEWINKAPIGYLNITNNDNTKDIIIDENKTFLIQDMFRLFSTGNYSVKTILEEITKKGLLSYRNKKLSPSMIHKILTDKFYIGTMTSKGNEYPHKHPKIVSEATFNKVQGILTKRNKRATKYASKPFIFRGMIKCADCGCSISPELKKGKYILYSCTNYKKKHPKKIYVNEKDLLKPVLEMLDNLKLPKKKIDEIVDNLKKFNENKTKDHLQHTTGDSITSPFCA